MKKVLIISYHFPPDAAIGAVRPGKFAQYLPEFGWKPVVLTVKEQHYESHDYGKMASVFDGTVKMHRVSLLPGPLQFYSEMRRRLLEVADERRFQVSDEEKKTGREQSPNRRRSIFSRLVSSLLRLPDVYQGWIINVALSGRRIIRREGIHTFITSGPPMSTHLGGLLLKVITGIRWIADFRDPWMSMHEFEDQSFRSEWRNRIEKRLERMVIAKADRVIATTPSVAKHFRSLLPEAPGARVSIIMNGYDDSDFEGLRSGEMLSPIIRICHAGTLYYGRNPEPFFQALSRLIDRGELDKNTIELEFIGNADFNGHPLSLLARKYHLVEQIVIVGKVTFHESLRRQKSAHALLLLAQKQPHAIPAKVFEYLKMSKPILVIADEGDTKRFLLPMPCCFVADAKRDDEIENRLMEMLRAIKDGSGNGRFGPAGQIEQFSRRNLTAQLASLL